VGNATSRSRFARATKACNDDLAYACSALGRQHEIGLGTSKSRSLALASYEHACRLDPYQCNNLAHAYRAGIGVDVDKTRSLDPIRKACDASNGVACWNAAAVHEAEGRGPRAREFIAKGCKASDMQSCLAQSQ